MGQPIIKKKVTEAKFKIIKKAAEDGLKAQEAYLEVMDRDPQTPETYRKSIENARDLFKRVIAGELHEVV